MDTPLALVDAWVGLVPWELETAKEHSSRWEVVLMMKCVKILQQLDQPLLTNIRNSTRIQENLDFLHFLGCIHHDPKILSFKVYSIIEYFAWCFFDYVCKIYSLGWTYTIYKNSSALFAQNGFIPTTRFPSVCHVRILYVLTAFQLVKRSQKFLWFVVTIIVLNQLLELKSICIFNKLLKGY